jgi:two-component system, chemotaxis family, chemotaxis protein CheY
LGSLATVRALIVDDCRPMRFLVRSVLRAAGMQKCLEATTAEEGLSLLRVHFIDLLITDLALRGQSGISFAHDVRRDDRVMNQFVSIVMMTGHSERRRVAAARDAGVNAFLAKPISARSLVEHVEVALNDGRLFVRTDNYFGPDRRRPHQEGYDGLRRRSSDDGPADFDLDEALEGPARRCAGASF